MKGEVPPQPGCQEEKRSQRERERHGRRPRGERREERGERREERAERREERTERAERPRRRLRWGIFSWGVVFCCFVVEACKIQPFYASEPSNFLVAYVYT